MHRFGLETEHPARELGFDDAGSIALDRFPGVSGNEDDRDHKVLISGGGAYNPILISLTSRHGRFPRRCQCDDVVTSPRRARIFQSGP
jgi:hypothetical protein